MRIEPTKDPDVIDRRETWARRALVGGSAVVVAVGAVLGVCRVPPRVVDPEQHLVDLVNDVTSDAQAFYTRSSSAYAPVKVVMYRGSTRTGCGRGLSDDGPFYCLADRRAYVDLSFLASIPTDLARAYVLAHELGHALEQARGEAPRLPGSELEADCLAGSWMRDARARGNLADGEIADAVALAGAAGDQLPATAPEAPGAGMPHGSGAQRVQALRLGYDGGLEACQTIPR